MECNPACVWRLIIVIVLLGSPRHVKVTLTTRSPAASELHVKQPPHSNRAALEELNQSIDSSLWQVQHERRGGWVVGCFSDEF